MLLKVLSSIWVRLRKGKAGILSLTAGVVSQDTNIERLLQSKIGFKDFEALRTSPDYKDKLKSNSFAMIRQLGPPTFFVTFSAAERLWIPLLTALEELNIDKQAHIGSQIQPSNLIPPTHVFIGQSLVLGFLV